MKCSIIYKIQHYFISVFVVLFLYTKYPKYTDISLKVLEGFWLIEKAVSAHYSCKKHDKTNTKQHKKRKILNRIKSHWTFPGITKEYFSCVDGFGPTLKLILSDFFSLYKICLIQSAACNSVISVYQSQRPFGYKKITDEEILTL